jgi:hypothetical protein
MQVRIADQDRFSTRVPSSAGVLDLGQPSPNRSANRNANRGVAFYTKVSPSPYNTILVTNNNLDNAERSNIRLLQVNCICRILCSTCSVLPVSPRCVQQYDKSLSLGVDAVQRRPLAFFQGVDNRRHNASLPIYMTTDRLQFTCGP